MTDREIIEHHDRQLEMLAQIQRDQAQIQRDQARMLERIITIQEQQGRHMDALAEAIHHLADRIGASH